MALTRLRTVDDTGNFEHPLYQALLDSPGLSVGAAALDDLLTWGLTNSLWIFPMATSCCGIEFMAAAGPRVDMDRMGTIVRGTPRQADVMVVAGTITVKMAPRVKKLWDQMPEPKWCIAMGSCAISGDFYRNLYPVVPGIDTMIPVDVYVPGCPPNPEALMHGLLRLQERVQLSRKGLLPAAEPNPDLIRVTRPSQPRLVDLERTAALDEAQIAASDDPTTDEATAAIEVAPGPDATLPADPNAADAAGVLAAFGVTETPKDGPPFVAPEVVVEIARRLKTLGYRQFTSVVASHWPAGVARKGKVVGEPEHFEVTYLLRTVGADSRVAQWSVRLEPGQSVPTLTGVFAGAEWQEREQWDLVGVPFAGHPDLRRLMMPENYQRHPLQRDFPSDAPLAPWR